MMCDCVDVEMGSYDNMVDFCPPPHHLKSSKSCISMDRCIVEEIQFLWKLGIVTIESCCGHNLLDACILVSQDDIPRMRELGYEHYPNQCDLTRQDGFYAKSVDRITPE